MQRRFFVQNRPSLVGMMQNWLPNRLIRLHLLHGRNSRAMNFRFDSRDQQRKQFFRGDGLTGRRASGFRTAGITANFQSTWNFISPSVIIALFGIDFLCGCIFFVGGSLSYSLHDNVLYGSNNLVLLTMILRKIVRFGVPIFMAKRLLKMPKAVTCCRQKTVPSTWIRTLGITMCVFFAFGMILNFCRNPVYTTLPWGHFLIQFSVWIPSIRYSTLRLC